jgi:hypothetical protein
MPAVENAAKEEPVRMLHEEQLRDIVLGFGEAVELATLDEIPESAWGAVIAGVGSPKSSLHQVRTKSPVIALPAVVA